MGVKGNNKMEASLVLYKLPSIVHKSNDRLEAIFDIHPQQTFLNIMLCENLKLHRLHSQIALCNIVDCSHSERYTIINQ
jgi:hypothetical protein